MGRPLFVARVESDIPSEKSASYARSPIRRNRRRGNSRVPLPPEAIPSLPSSLPPEELRTTYSQNRAHSAEQRAGLSRPAGLRPTRREAVPTYALPWDIPPDGERVERERVRLLVEQGRVSQALRVCPLPSPGTSASVAAANMMLQAGNRHSPSSRRTNERWFGLPEQSSTRTSSSARFRRAFEEYTNSRGDTSADGLGDRNRSLSPEGAHVWDTLLTSITPDPQPPSLGSSFASTAASQSATGSAATSFTEPDLAPPDAALAADQGCESGPEDRDTSDAEDDDELAPAIASGFRRHIPRSHPSARPSLLSTGQESENDFMMSIVRHLARRHNVPPSFLEDMERLRRERNSSN